MPAPRPTTNSRLQKQGTQQPPLAINMCIQPCMYLSIYPQIDFYGVMGSTRRAKKNQAERQAQHRKWSGLVVHMHVCLPALPGIYHASPY